MSIGDILDKMAILDIKTKMITDNEKKVYIDREFKLYEEYFKHRDDILYKMLFYINKKIWYLTDEIRLLKYTDEKFSKIANDIFLSNDSRFRIKNKINLEYESAIREQKNMDKKIIKILIGDSQSLDDNILFLCYLFFDYDVVIVYLNDDDYICYKDNKYIFDIRQNIHDTECADLLHMKEIFFYDINI